MSIAFLISLQVPVLKPMELMVEASPRRIFANAHTYHINSISVNSDGETYLSADDLRINLWHMEITDQSFNIVDIKPANMEELTEVGARNSDQIRAIVCLALFNIFSNRLEHHFRDSRQRSNRLLSA